MHELTKAFKLIKRRHEWLKYLKQDKESYGLIHGDIKVGNFMVNHNVITMFDFDECQYSWCVKDIAIHETRSGRK
ncbi:phosphotransferase [Paenibacillus sp. MER TA 81-3]|uniref:phosphotransferase n=1 Tax=Paenibacillus sp. MER TA 81-3 TaxID=2939573 RepID=UPI0034D97AB7